MTCEEHQFYPAQFDSQLTVEGDEYDAQWYHCSNCDIRAAAVITQFYAVPVEEVQEEAEEELTRREIAKGVVDRSLEEECYDA